MCHHKHGCSSHGNNYTNFVLYINLHYIGETEEKIERKDIICQCTRQSKLANSNNDFVVLTCLITCKSNVLYLSPLNLFAACLLHQICTFQILLTFRVFLPR